MAEKNNKGAHEAVVRANSLTISAKNSIVICKQIKGKNVKKAKKMLEEAITLKRPIKFTRFNADLGHKRGIGPGKYPVKSAKAILHLLNSLEANAADKGLNKESLKITSAIANWGPKRWHVGRQRRTAMKNTHIEIKAEEEKKAVKAVKKETTEKKGEKK